jgi:hypothetical protein
MAGLNPTPTHFVTDTSGNVHLTKSDQVPDFTGNLTSQPLSSIANQALGEKINAVPVWHSAGVGEQKTASFFTGEPFTKKFWTDPASRDGNRWDEAVGFYPAKDGQEGGMCEIVSQTPHTFGWTGDSGGQGKAIGAACASDSEIAQRAQAQHVAPDIQKALQGHQDSVLGTYANPQTVSEVPYFPAEEHVINTSVNDYHVTDLSMKDLKQQQ